jgi:hypothetical protein
MFCNSKLHTCNRASTFSITNGNGVNVLPSFSLGKTRDASKQLCDASKHLLEQISQRTKTPSPMTRLVKFGKFSNKESQPKHSGQENIALLLSVQSVLVSRQFVLLSKLNFNATL